MKIKLCNKIYKKYLTPSKKMIQMNLKLAKCDQSWEVNNW